MTEQIGDDIAMWSDEYPDHLIITTIGNDDAWIQSDYYMEASDHD